MGISGGRIVTRAAGNRHAVGTEPARGRHPASTQPAAAAMILSQWAEVTGHDPEAIQETAELAARHAETGEPQSFTRLEPAAVFPPFSLAPLYVLVGQYDRAPDLLERGYEEGAFGVVSNMFGPPVRRLRNHPRFVALAERVGPGS